MSEGVRAQGLQVYTNERLKGKTTGALVRTCSGEKRVGRATVVALAPLAIFLSPGPI